MTHVLKTTPAYFQDVWTDKKQFECRLNDRDFKIGDQVILKEWYGVTGTYTKRSIHIEITYILHSFPGLDQDCIVFSFIIKNRVFL